MNSFCAPLHGLSIMQVPLAARVLQLESLVEQQARVIEQLMSKGSARNSRSSSVVEGGADADLSDLPGGKVEEEEDGGEGGAIPLPEDHHW